MTDPRIVAELEAIDDRRAAAAIEHGLALWEACGRPLCLQIAAACSNAYRLNT